ncbi:MAG: metallophosphoesterase [Gammaproteobacteria bacterium]
MPLALLALLLSGPAAAEAYRFSTGERVVAVGDIHGALDEFVAVLQGTGLIDEDLAWRGGATTLVSVGDLVDRGDYGRQVMDQSRAFGSSTDIAATLRRSGLKVTPQMAEALARVTPEAAAFLSEYLHDRQVRALVERAARLRSRQ